MRRERSERTLDQSLNRADGLRMIADFREDYSNAGDQDDIVLLADEILRLRTFLEQEGYAPNPLYVDDEGNG